MMKKLLSKLNICVLSEQYHDADEDKSTDHLK